MSKYKSESWWIVYRLYRFSCLGKNEKITIIHINKKDNKYIEYAVTVALNQEEIKKDTERITKIKTFKDK